MLCLHNKEICPTIFVSHFRDQSRSYHRFNSLEGECHTQPKTAKMDVHNLDTKIQPTAREQKWFNGHYNSNPIHYYQQQQPNYWPTQQLEQPSFQVPYNLNKGQFEIWPMEALQQQQQFVDPHVAYITQDTSMHYQPSNNVSILDFRLNDVKVIH